MNNIITFGENHTNKNEISEIRNKILEIKPDIILHELDWEDRDFYKSNIPGVKILPLEPSNKKKITIIHHLTHCQLNYNF